MICLSLDYLLMKVQRNSEVSGRLSAGGRSREHDTAVLQTVCVVQREHFPLLTEGFLEKYLSNFKFNVETLVSRP